MSDPVFLASSTGGGKKRKPKKSVPVEDEEPEPERPRTPEDEGENPLAQAMANSAAQVQGQKDAEGEGEGEGQKQRYGAAAAKKKSNLALSFNSNSQQQSNELNDAAESLSNYAKAGEQRSGQGQSGGSSFTQSNSRSSASSGRGKRDEFDSALDQALGGRTAASVTSSGYIDPNDIETIRRTQKAKGQQVQDEFEFEEVADVTAQSLAQPQSKANQFDEFEDVWAQADSAAANGPPAGGRKVLKASKTQKQVEKPDAKEEAKRKLEQALRDAEKREEEERLEKERLEAQGLQNPILAKLGIAPTNILAQYDDTKVQPTLTAQKDESEQKSLPGAKKKKPLREQDQLESTDDQLKPAQAPVVNVVDSLVKAHTSTASSFIEAAPVDEVDQWGAVNKLREKQELAAKKEAERLAQQGKQIGVKMAEEITRDTPIHYDAALKALTVAPSCPSPAIARATAADGSSGSGEPANPNSTPPPPSTSVQIQLLKQKIQSQDFRDIGFSRKMRYTFFPPNLKSTKLEEERDLCFCMALMKVDYEHCVDHERILCSLYRGLTGDQLAPPTFGNHWQVIGFQANDPATDLRGAGLFSLIQLLWFMKHHKELMLKIYQLSLDDRQNFPFCTLSTNITGMALQALRECVIYGECRRQQSVYTVVHTLYVAAFYEMYLKWKNENCTIVSWNDVKQHLENLVLHSPKPLMAKFKANQYNLGDQAQQGALEFTEIP